MSVCDPVGGMHSMFADVLPQQVFADRPPGRPDADVAAWAEAFERLADQHADELAGIISSRCCRAPAACTSTPAECLRVLREVADEHGLVLVFDEIATGFGRTGTFFAAEPPASRPTSCASARR